MVSFSEAKQLWRDYPVVAFFCVLIGGGVGYAIGTAHINYVSQARDYFRSEMERLGKAQNEVMNELGTSREKLAALGKNEDLLRAELARVTTLQKEIEKKSPSSQQSAGS